MIQPPARPSALQRRLETLALTTLLALLFLPALSTGQPVERATLSEEEARILRERSEGGDVQANLPDGAPPTAPGHARLSQRDGSIPVDEETLIDSPGCDGMNRGCNNEGCLPDFDVPQGCGQNGCSPESCSGGGCDAQPRTRDVSQSIVPAIIGSILLALIIILALQFIRRRNRNAFDEEQEHALIQEARDAATLDPEQAAREGNYALAIHRVYLATLLEMNDAGLIIRAAWTPREIAAHAQLGDAATPLGALTYLAERVHFGKEGGSAEMLREAESLAAEARRLYDAAHRGDESEEVSS